MAEVPSYLYDFVDHHARTSPERTALSDERHHYSYADLSHLSSHFAEKIRAVEDVSGKHIGLLYDRSAQSIILLLAIMKAGGVYVPLNSELPKKRLDAMIDSADIALIISPGGKTKSKKRKTLVFRATQSTPPKPPNPTNSHHALAYAIFTSGSTGVPKLALLSHASVIHVMTHLTERYYINKSDRVMQFANLSFDGSISEIFGAFVAGAELVVPSDGTVHSITRLSDYLIKKSITIAVLPPSLISHIAVETSQLKTLIAAGEPCPSSLARTASLHIPHFINAYGPTECSICVSTYEVPAGFNDKTTPIGKPLPGVNALVVNDALQPVKGGELGELLISGPTLFEGYYGDPDKTASAIIVVDSERFYRTGDFVTLSQDGLRYDSRSDDYIKIHGLRISPREIEEATLQFSPTLLNVAVVAVDNGGDLELRGFYESSTDHRTEDILQFLKTLLPAYAIPQSFTKIESFPLTVNKKIDRRALAFLATRDTTATTQLTTEELSVEDLWASLLGIEVTNSTDFFLSGGDSLRAMRLLATIDKQRGTGLTLSDLFEHPTLADFSAFIETLSKDAPSDTYDSSQLSPYETMLWSASAHAGNAAAYTLTEVLAPDFEVDERRLRDATQSLSRHFIAASYRYTMGEQGLEKSFSGGIAFAQTDFSSSSDFDAFVEKLSNTAIDLSRDPLIAIHLASIEGKSRVIVHAHHIALSASILGPFVTNLWRQYINEPYEQPEQELYRSPTEKDLQFWQEHFSTTAEYVQLPWKDVRRPKPQNNGATLIQHGDSLKDRIAKVGVTKFVFYRAVFSMLLHKLSGQRSFYIGSSVDVRNSEILGTKPAMLNTLPIQSTITDRTTFIEHLHETQNHVRASLDHALLPLHDIIKLHPFEQDRLVGPFNVLFDYVQKPDSFSIPGLGMIQSTQYFNKTAKYDLTLTVNDSSKTELLWEYDSDLLDEQTVQQLSQMFLNLCERVLNNSAIKINDISLLDDNETTRMMTIGEGRSQQYSSLTFYDRFVSSVARYPEAIAIKQAGIETSYQDLSYLVDHYTAILLDHHLPQETGVAIFMERSAEMIAAIIALWRLGYAYVPIETNLPSHRIRSLIEATKTPIILTRSHHKGKLPLAIDASIIDESFQPKTTHLSTAEVSPSTLAYVIFTSGSTGTPKGVMIEHGGMMNHAEGMIAHLGLNKHSVIGQTASHSFDISVWQLTTLIMVGGTIVIYSKDEQGDLASLIDRIHTDRVTLLELVPSYISILIEYVEDTNAQEKLQSVEDLISTGENISWPIIEGWFRNFPHCRLINAYGPAEASDDTNLFTFSDTTTMGQRGLAIGSPLPNVTVFVLDDSLNPQPIGIQGEIYIAGVAVGRGYINDPKRTEKAFIIHPKTGQRMYKTGDLGYWSADGQLIYMGRSDFQVKVRGFRIELEEIEAHVIRYPNITAVAVVVVERNGIKQLHAFITADTEINSDAMLFHLRQYLPEYMVPSTIIQLSALPLNNSGKIDRALLANKERLRFKEFGKTSGLSDAEIAVIKTWREVFSIEHISPDDNYYSFGGDSITSFRVYAKLHKLGYQVTLQDILALPVLKDFARSLVLANGPSVTTDTITGILPFSPVQARYLSHTHKTQMLQNILLEGSWERTRLDSAIQYVARKQGALSMNISESGQEFDASPRLARAYSFVESSIDQEAAFEKLSSELGRGMLFAYGAVGDDTNITHLYMSASHLVVDVVSWNNFVSDLEEAYTHGDHSDKAVDYTLGTWVKALAAMSPPTAEEVSMWQNALQASEESTRRIKSAFLQQYDSGLHIKKVFPLPTQGLTESASYWSVLESLSLNFHTPQSCIMIETHGRYGEVVGINTAQTMGWFTQLLPMSGSSEKKLDALLHASEQTKLSYNLAVQHGIIDISSEPPIIVNFLGKLNPSRYSFVRGKQEVAIGDEAMEVTIYEDGKTITLDAILYKEPADRDAVEAFLDNIGSLLSAELPTVDDKRLQAILNRIGNK